MKPLRKRKVLRVVELEGACMIREGEDEYCIYPLDDVMAVLGKKWALFVIAVLGNQTRARFNDLLRQLGGISSRTLSDRLKELEGLGLLQRAVFPEVPPRVEYSLTDHGRRMRRALIPFLRWSIEFERSRSSGPTQSP